MEEIGPKKELLEKVARRAQEGTVTLLCWCKDEARCHRTLLRGLVEKVTPKVRE